MSSRTLDFTQPATAETVEKVAVTLISNNIEAIVVDTGEEARRRVLELVPAGANVHSGKSKTLEDVGLFDAFADGDYDWLRRQQAKLDRTTQRREITKLVATPDFLLGSAQALTEDGVLAFASYSGGQIGPLSAGAARVILVVGSQKIVPDVASALKRIEEHVFPYEDARLRETMGVPTRLAKVLLSFAEPMPGRTTVFLVREPLGV